MATWNPTDGPDRPASYGAMRRCDLSIILRSWISHACGFQLLRFARRQYIVGDHSDSGIGSNETCSGVSSGILVHQDYRNVLRRNELSGPDGHYPRNYRFCETAEAIRKGGLPFGAIACFDLATEAADRALSRAATPCKPPPTANTDARFVRLMRRGHGRYCANISKFLVSSW
jgi:hypothetical protein